MGISAWLRTPQEDPQSQLTWDNEGSQSLDLDPYTFVANVQLGLHMGPLTIGTEVVSDCYLPLDPVPITGLPG